MVCTIYKITNDKNDKVYVGQTWRSLKERFWEHCKPSQKGCIKLHRAIKKYGSYCFDIEPILICYHQEAADYLEICFISKYNSIVNGYNLKEGGSHGKHSEETKRKISKALMGRPSPRKGVIVSPETREKLRIASTGKVCSEATKRKISQANKGNISPRKGVILSDVTKLKCSKNSSHKKLSEDNVKKLLSLWNSGEYYQSELANMFNINQSAVSRIVNGKTYLFVNKEENENL